MANTLIIKGADFSGNKLDTVAFNDVPCTGISLSDATKTLTTIGATYTLTPILTPSNTTDSITWSSSDSDVVSVGGGVITAVGVGSATITAICGSYSAICTVTVSVAFAPAWYYAYPANKRTLTSPVEYTCIAIGDNAQNYAFAYKSTGTYKVRATTPDAFPYPIPNGTKKVSIAATGFKIGLWFSDSTTPSGEIYASIVGDGNNASATAAPQDSAVYTVPEGADSFVMTLKMVSGETITESDLSNVVVTFIDE